MWYIFKYILGVPAALSSVTDEMIHQREKKSVGDKISSMARGEKANGAHRAREHRALLASFKDYKSATRGLHPKFMRPFYETNISTTQHQDETRTIDVPLQQTVFDSHLVEEPAPVSELHCTPSWLSPSRRPSSRPNMLRAFASGELACPTVRSGQKTGADEHNPPIASADSTTPGPWNTAGCDQREDRNGLERQRGGRRAGGE